MLRLEWCGVTVTVGALLVAGGCFNTPIRNSEFARGPVPLREPSSGRAADADCCYVDSLTGAKIFAMYCGACHNARPLSERPFSNYQNVAAHMRVRANLTGKEYAKLMEWLRRWHDVPPPNSPVEPSAKVLTFSQPVQELRPEAQKGAEVGGQPGKAPAPPGGQP
jgi:hypothetical protein